MKVSCNQSSLAKQLAIVGRLVGGKPSLPILANVLLETQGSKLKFTVTDLELGVHTWIGAEVKGDGKITIPARTFSEFVNSLPDGKVDLDLEKQVLKVTATNNSAQFNTLPCDDYPAVPSIEDGELLMSIDPDELQKAINRVTIAAAADDSRPVFTGINVEAEGTGLTLVAVDGFRLSRQYLTMDKAVKEKITILVPARSFQELGRIINDLSDGNEKKKKDKVDIYLLKGKNQVIFHYKEADLISRLLDGQFPEYKKIIPTGYEVKAEMAPSDFQNAVKIVNIFARNVIGNKAVIEVASKDKQVKVSADLAEVGANESSFGTDVEGNDLKIAFSAKFLTDMLSTMGGEKMVFEGTNPTAPGVFRIKGDDSYLHMVMPMRMN